MDLTKRRTYSFWGPKMAEVLRRSRKAGIRTDVSPLSFAEEITRHVGVSIPTSQPIEDYAAEVLRHWPQGAPPE